VSEDTTPQVPESTGERRQRQKKFRDAVVLAVFVPGLAAVGLHKSYAVGVIALAIRLAAPFAVLWLADAKAWSAHVFVWAAVSTQVALWGGEVVVAWSASRRQRHEQWAPSRAFVWALAVIAAAAFGARGLPIQGYKSAAASMLPSVSPNERVLVRSDIMPARGDIVVFIAPPQVGPRNGAGEPWLKRLIGLPGDTIAFEEQDGNVVTTINEVRLPTSACDPSHLKSIQGVVDPFSGRKLRLPTCLLEGNPAYAVAQQHDVRSPVTLGPGEVFIVGDNRDNSHDSRRWGPAPADSIVGVVWGKYSWKPWEPPTYDAGRQPRLLRAQKQNP